MMANVYCYYNRKAGFYTAPIVSPYDKDQIVELTHQSFIANVGSPEHLQQLEHDLYFLGLFDTKTGAFQLELKPEFLTTFTEVTEDGRKEDSDN